MLDRILQSPEVVDRLRSEPLADVLEHVSKHVPEHSVAEHRVFGAIASNPAPDTQQVRRSRELTGTRVQFRMTTRCKDPRIAVAEHVVETPDVAPSSVGPIDPD